MPRRVSPREAFELMAQGYVYLDVRSTPEVERGRPEGAVCVPLAEMGPAGMQPNPHFLEMVRARFPADARLVVGCEAGGRSARACALLSAAGYVHVVDQRAGFGGACGPGAVVVERGWRDEGLPAESGPLSASGGN